MYIGEVKLAQCFRCDSRDGFNVKDEVEVSKCLYSNVKSKIFIEPLIAYGENLQVSFSRG